MRLQGKYFREIIAHAREGKPNEVCGLIAGRDGHPVKLYRTTNNDPRPRVRYNVEPLELLTALREMEDRQWNLLAIYHSHPMSEAYPSGTDVGLAYYPDAVYLIVSLAGDLPADGNGKGGPVVRAFKIVDRRVIEEELEVYEEVEQPEATPRGGRM